MEALFFYLFGTLAVLSALLTITRRDAVTSAFWLIFSFLCLAGLYALLNAHFMAILQILLYAGAIMVFFLFVTMFLGKDPRVAAKGNRLLFLLGLASVVALGFALSRVMGAGSAGETAFPQHAHSYGSLERVSQLLLTRYVFGFEMVGLLLTVAVIGAVHLARREAAGSRSAREVHLRSEELREARKRLAAAEKANEQAHAEEAHHA